MKKCAAPFFSLPLLVAFVFLTNVCKAQADTALALLPGEYWWGGAATFGHKMPFTGSSNFNFNLLGEASENQSSPVLVSNKGRWIWSDAPFSYTFQNGSLSLQKSSAPLQIGTAGNTLSTAYRHVSGSFFAPDGQWPDSLLVKAPQYNLWIELQYHPTQTAVLDYANSVIRHGFPPGVLMIDDNWSFYYGAFEFNKQTFPDARATVDELHRKGFKVMLWICPFISPDSESFRELEQKKFLLLDNEGNQQLSWDKAKKPLIIKWWNGYSACLDFTNPGAKAWLLNKLNYLHDNYGIDGYKFDAGDPYFYNSPNLVSFKKATPNEHTTGWAEIGLSFPFNEYRAMWKMGGKPLVQRLADKNHSWEDLQRLIPNTIAQQLLGYTFTCPDLIGGGQITSFLPGSVINQKLVVRSAQLHALMPMMQFSAAPWRILDATNFDAVKKAVAMRMQYLPTLMEVMRTAAKTGEPAVRPMEYNYPNLGFAAINDQFMLGDRILVAPVITETDTRTVVLPPGTWVWNQKKWKGGKSYTLQVPLDAIPIFIKQ